MSQFDPRFYPNNLPPATGATAPYLRPAERHLPTQPEPARGAKVRATLYLSLEVLEEARNAAVHLAGYPARLTLAKLADDALRAELQRLKDLYNQGRDFPPRDADLRGGRPIAA